MPGHIRLHISPLSPELLSTVLPPLVLASASNISYHAIQTFPERSYGYVDLPTMEAEKIKKKLNGSIFKGSKMRLEEARPEKKTRIIKVGTIALQENEGGEKTQATVKKRKREEGLLVGHELTKERKVKRGWTEPSTGSRDTKRKQGRKDTKIPKEKTAKVQASSFTEKPECLFRTKLPLNVKRVDDSKSASQSKSEKFKVGKADRETTVHEFSNTTKYAGFLRDSQAIAGKPTLSEYVEGKGWVDNDGKIVETVDSAKKRLWSQKHKTKSPKESSSTGLKTGKLPSIEEHSAKDLPTKPVEDTSETSSSGISSSSEDDGGSEEDNSSISDPNIISSDVKKALQSSLSAASPTRDIDNDEDDAASSSSLPHLSVTQSAISSSTSTPAQTSSNIHPLEALFKCPQSTSTNPRKPSLEVQTSFSFFGPDSSDSALHVPVPQTPFTIRDTQLRRLRSAAPTPDTAAPSKAGFGPLWGNNESESEDGKEGEEEENKATGDRAPKANDEMGKAEPKNDEEGESAFAKWFWEHRGETNRAWKGRRREAGKEKRQRENRRRGIDVT